MSRHTGDGKLLERRGFLKNSAMMAAAAALGRALTASAQEPQNPAPAPEDRKEEPAKKEEPPKKKVLLDKNGREYRVCDMCGGNMYKEAKTWTCEQCGFSYDE
jgi:anaerobic selenocysteine-containing dehydrogenase